MSTGLRNLEPSQGITLVLGGTGKTGRRVAERLTARGVPQEIAWLLNYLFDTVLDGRNAHVCDGVQRALGRQPTDFAEYARQAAASGVWTVAG